MVNRASIDGKDFYTIYGVVVEKITGEMDFPRIKEPMTRRWEDDHGDDVYLDKIYYESRSIQIACYIDGTSAANYLAKINTFFKALTAPRPRYLKVQGNTFGYLVYMKECSTITRLTAIDTGRVIGRFTLSLLDFCPINRQFIRNSSGTTFTISCAKPLTIWWGDGTTEMVKGTDQIKAKSFNETVPLNIMIYGSVESISSLAVTGAVETI